MHQKAAGTLPDAFFFIPRYDADDVKSSYKKKRKKKLFRNTFC